MYSLIEKCSGRPAWMETVSGTDGNFSITLRWLMGASIGEVKGKLFDAQRLWIDSVDVWGRRNRKHETWANCRGAGSLLMWQAAEYGLDRGALRMDMLAVETAQVFHRRLGLHRHLQHPDVGPPDALDEYRGDGSDGAGRLHPDRLAHFEQLWTEARRWSPSLNSDLQSVAQNARAQAEPHWLIRKLGGPPSRPGGSTVGS